MLRVEEVKAISHFKTEMQEPVPFMSSRFDNPFTRTAPILVTGQSKNGWCSLKLQ